MGSIRIGKWEISPQSGTSGTNIKIGHRLVERHTGRKKYQKLVKAIFSKSSVDKESVETLEIPGLEPFLTLNTVESEVTHNVTWVVINGVSNASKFRVSSLGKDIQLDTNTGYTVAEGNEGIFANGFGELSEGKISIKVKFTPNIFSQIEVIPIKVEHYDGSNWVQSGIYTVIQHSSDTGVSFAINPPTLPNFPSSGGTNQVEIDSNVEYSIELQGDIETSWVSLSRITGKPGKESLQITVLPQETGQPLRQLTIKFKSTFTGSVVGILEVRQEEGEAYSIAWRDSIMVFTNEDIGLIKTNELTANGDWYIEEKV